MQELLQISITVQALLELGTVASRQIILLTALKYQVFYSSQQRLQNNNNNGHFYSAGIRHKRRSK